jgi:anti-sigma B factor antagonist
MFRQHADHSREGEVLCAPQELVIRSERKGAAHVVKLSGELDKDSAPRFETVLKRVEMTDAREIIVDLSALTFIGSDGLKVFIHANARSRGGGKRLMLIRGNDEVQRTFETAGLLSRLPFDGARELLRPPPHLKPARAQLVVSRPVQAWIGSDR